MHRLGLSLLVVGLLAVAAAYACTLLGIGARVAPWWLASGSTAVLAGLAVLGAARRARATPRLLVAAALSFTSVAAGLAIPLLMPAPTIEQSLLLGLPRPTTWLLLLVGLGPLVLLPLGYAAAFEREVLSDADLAALRATVPADPDA